MVLLRVGQTGIPVLMALTMTAMEKLIALRFLIALNQMEGPAL